MITVKVYRDRVRNPTGFVATGHAGYAPWGEDIVCSAVSVLTQTAVLGLEAIDFPADSDIREGNMSLTLRKAEGISRRKAEDASLILETIILGLKAVAESHPKHVRVIDDGLRRC